MTEVERLRKAATLIRNGFLKFARQGWDDKQYKLAPTYCALGAIAAAKYGPDGGFDDRLDRDDQPLLETITETLGLRKTCIPGLSISEWNNHPDRTAEDVAQGLCLVAVKLEAEQLKTQRDEARQAATELLQTLDIVRNALDTSQ